VARLKLLWVSGGAGLLDASVSEFAGSCDVVEVGLAELSSTDVGEDWDLVCFDFDYPEMTGLRLITETKRRWPSAPILMLTMQASADLALWALRARVFDVLVKPITPPEIGRCMRRVHEALQARRSQSERKPQAALIHVPAETRYRPQVAPSTRLQLAVALIAKHYMRPLRESEVALACEMSPSRFCREFKAEFGVTFVEYLSSYRVSEAKRLLANAGISVTDVATAVGFPDPSYFTRVFRKQENVSPSEYRTTLAGSSARSDARHVLPVRTGS
jgi:YesN/AraC family two-component response regulator